MSLKPLMILDSVLISTIVFTVMMFDHINNLTEQSHQDSVIISLLISTIISLVIVFGFRHIVIHRKDLSTKRINLEYGRYINHRK